jgi:hypothetical protein
VSAVREYILTDAEREALRRFFGTGEKTGELRVLETRIRENLISGRLPQDYQFIQRWVHAYCDGKIRTYVARGNEPVPKVAKTILAMIRKRGISPTETESILKARTVDAFAGNHELFHERSQRLAELRELLVKL